MAYSDDGTSFPPLTTTFTPPASCATARWTYVDFSTNAIASGTQLSTVSQSTTTLYRPWEGGAQLPTDSVSLTRDFDYNACLPSDYFGAVGHYSPGVCPQGQTTATAIDTQGTSVAICCPTDFTVTDENQGCVSTYTRPTTVNYFAVNEVDPNASVEVRQGATVGPGVMWVRALVMLQATATSTAGAAGKASGASSNQATAQFNAPITTSSPEQGSGPSNRAIIGITAGAAIAAIAALLLGGFLLRRRRPSKARDDQSAFSRKTGSSIVLLLPLIVAVLVGIATCLLAAHQSWQEDMIRRWASPNSVLRVIQVLSFIIRLCATVLAWCCVADIGWLMMSRGLCPAQMVRVFDMAAVGGSYATIWNALWTSLRRLSWLNSIVLLFAIVVALASDLVGNAIIASTGVDYIVGRNNTVSNLPFMQVGYVNSDTSMFGSDDQVVSLFSSANYYPHILQFNDDNLAFLPVQAGEALPSSYSGVAYFGSIASNCAPAKLNGSVFVANNVEGGEASSIDNTFGMEGFLEVPFDNFPGSPLNISFTKQGMTFGRMSTSNPDSILGAWTVPQANANSSIQYFGTLLVSNLTESFVMTDTSSHPVSHGNLLINDGQSEREGMPGGTFTIQVCRLSLPSSFGTISAPKIQQSAIRAPSSCNLAPSSLCPNISIYPAGPGASVQPWSNTQILSHLNASFLDFSTVDDAINPFSDGVIFCRSCNATGVAARVLSTFVSSSASGLNFPSAFKTAILHAIASTYRNELPTLNGGGSASFTLLEPATLVIDPPWIYASVAFVVVLGLVTLAMKSYTSSFVGAERSGSVLSAASLIVTPSPLAAVVRGGSYKNRGELENDVNRELPDEIMGLGAVNGEERFGIGFVGNVRRRTWGQSGQYVGVLEGRKGQIQEREIRKYGHGHGQDDGLINGSGTGNEYGVGGGVIKGYAGANEERSGSSETEVQRSLDNSGRRSRSPFRDRERNMAARSRSVSPL